MTIVTITIPIKRGLKVITRHLIISDSRGYNYYPD